MKEFLIKYGGWICTGILITVLLFIIFGKRNDYSEAQKKIDDYQKERDSISLIKEELSISLDSTKEVISEREAEKDSIYSLLLEANNKLIYAYQNQKRSIRVDDIGSDSLRKYYSQLPR